MSQPRRLLVLGDADHSAYPWLDQLQSNVEVVVSSELEPGLKQLQNANFGGVLFLKDGDGVPGGVLEVAGILEEVPDAIVLLDLELQIIWSNPQLADLTESSESLVGRNFYEAFGSPEILGPDFCPFHTALATGEAARSTLRVGEKSYFEVHAKPVFEQSNEDVPAYLAIIVRDISAEVLQRQKLNAIYHAGLELGDLAPNEILEMSVSERVELLKSKILHYTKDLLEFETVEIRLLDKRTKQLEPLLSEGMHEDASQRALYAEATGNGVTGFVAATGKSYLCEDTGTDPLYLPGAAGASSSLTVPLVLHEEVLGTFNVESPRPGAFDENDLQFLELFTREVAVALNTLELLVAEKMTTATESTQRILQEVAPPVDEILNDAAWILERYIGHEPSVADRLQKILKHTREIRQVIHKVGEKIRPKSGRTPLPGDRPEHPVLRGKRILVVDSDDSIRLAAHELLGRYGCIVETAHDGDESFLMSRGAQYDAVIADIRLPDMTGYECFHKLKQIAPHMSVILMTGFGYDPSHSIVKARQEGLKSVLYKPFRLDQLLEELEKAVSPPQQDAT